MKAMRVTALIILSLLAKENIGLLAMKTKQKVFDRLLECVHLGGPSVSSRLDPAERNSLLLFDKDILEHEQEKGKTLHSSLLGLYRCLSE